EFWTSGQWMTEITGGSDVGLSQTVAIEASKDVSASPPKPRDAWRLYGNKWFTSAVNSQIALTLARPQGNPPGGRGLALFYVELRDENGRLRNLQINRLKDKLGTRKVPTAELTLDGTPAQLVMGTTDGVRNIAPLLNITRLWNGISSVALMRRGLALAHDYASKRIAFGAPLSEKPLHMDTLAGLQAEFEGAFHLAFYVAELTGKSETGDLGEDEKLLLRVLTPVMKLTTGKQAVMVASEVLECFGGAGYIEDTGLPTLLRDSQVLPIWEGTTNVLSLDTLRALGVQSPTSTFQSPSSNIESVRASAFQAFKSEVTRCLNSVRDPHLVDAARIAHSTLDHAERWLTQSTTLESGARRFALTLGRTMELALLIRHAQWSQDHESDARATVAAARRFAHSGVDLLSRADMEDEPVK
ncbi:MAG: acyl-CoA dehydrogenase family protein, partial [Gammaproteobacteria bacterium]